MDVDLLTAHVSHVGAVASPDLLTAPDSLQRQLEFFILSCRVDGLSPATLKYYSYTLERFVRFCYQSDLTNGGMITAHHVRIFLLKLQETNNPTSVHDYFRSVKRFFNWLVEEGLLKLSPVKTIKPPRIPRQIVKPFSVQDIANMLLLCAGNRFLDLRNRAMVLLFLDTGLRLSELAAIQLGDIDFDHETIKVMGKGARERKVRVGATTQKALLKYLMMRSDEHSCLWVTEERRPLARDGIQTSIERLCKRAEVKGARPGPHTFRHTAAIHCLRNGMGEFTLQLMLGHSTLKMTSKYVSSLNQEDMIKAHKIASPVDNLRLK